MPPQISLQHLDDEAPVASTAYLTQRQEEILDLLEAIFRDEGFRTLTIGELAKRLKCSRSTLYSIAATKEELFLLVTDRLLQRTGSEGAVRGRGIQSPSARLNAYLEGTASYFARVRRAFMRDVLSYGPARSLYESHQKRFIAHMRKIVEAGIEAGEFSSDLSPRLVAEALDGAMSRLRESRFLKEQGMDLGEAFQQLSTLFRRGLDNTGSRDKVRDAR
jgi:AcrR family transcriptional regulator